MAAFVLERAAEPLKSDLLTSFFLDDYWKNHACRVESEERIEYGIRHLQAHFGMLPPPDITAEVVALYVRKRMSGEIGRPSGDGTIRRELGILVAALNHAVRARKLDAGKVPYIPMPKEPAAKERWLERDEAERLRGACQKNLRLRIFVEIGLHTGARKSVIESLRWTQVDMNNGIIDFNTMGRRQTGKRRPKVPIADALKPWLWKSKDKWPDSEYVLGKDASIKQSFEAATNLAGLQPARPAAGCSRSELEMYRRKRVTKHTLRHTYATWAVQSGVSLWDVAGVLGDTLATVEKKYAHHAPDYLRGAVNFKHKEVVNA